MHKDKLTEILAIEELGLPRIVVPEADPTFLPIHLTGGIGDAILAIPTLKALRSVGVNPVAYSPHAAALNYFYDAVTCHTSPMPAFTWHLEVSSVARFRFSPNFGGFLCDEHRHLFDQHQTVFDGRPDLRFLVYHHPEYKALLAARAVKLGHTAETFPQYLLDFSSNVRLETPRKSPATSYITIHDGYDASYAHMVTQRRATKQWTLQNWDVLVSLIQSAYPGIEVVQLGLSKTASPIKSVTSMVDKTTITEAFDIIAKSRLHIDTDSGLAHAATALGVPSVVMFGPTPASFYGHAQNINLTSQASCAGGCFHLSEDWMAACPIGYDSPKCMDDITPAMVMDAVGKLLG